MSRTNFDTLLEAGCHFGHLKRKWNPAMAPYIFMERNGIHIIDLHKTVAKVDEAAEALKQIAKSGKKVLFVATKKQAKQVVADKAASVTVQGKDIAVGTDIKEGEDIVYAGTTKLDVVLQNMQDSIQTAVSGGLTGVVAGDGINVSNVVANKQTITAKLSTDESNLLKLGSDKGLFVAIYYDGDDAE